MDYSYVRKLVKEVSETDVQNIYDKLTQSGIEVFVESECQYVNATAESVMEHSKLYVCAADLEYARTLVGEIGLEQYLCSEAEANIENEKSELELAEEEFYRKHRQNQIFAWVIIAAVIVFMIFQFFK